jgi:hypothetical protein
MTSRYVFLGAITSLLAGLAANGAEERSPVTVDASAYSNLQAAVDALPPGGGTVLLPPSVFRLEKTLNLSFALHSNTQFSVCLKGAGKLATTILLSNVALRDFWEFQDAWDAMVYDGMTRRYGAKMRRVLAYSANPTETRPC